MAAAALEYYVNQVRILSSQGSFTQLSELVSKSLENLSKNVSNLDNALGTFDLQQHTLGVLGILYVKYNLPNIGDHETLFTQTEQFIAACNGEQLRYATNLFAELCSVYTETLTEKKQQIRGIGILCKAISKIQVAECQLTSIHANLCLLCLQSKCLKPALRFLDADINEISREGGQYEARHFLLYYYYGGLIYTALKNYDRAVYFFEVAITTPSMAVSHIMLEAYKKYILVSLIAQGKVPNPPKYTSQVVQRYVKPLCQPYHDLAQSYQASNATELRAQVLKHQETFNTHQNIGLVKQVVTSLIKRNIQRLTKTFLTLSLADMANRVQLPSAKEAERYIVNMIEDGEIFAAVNQKDGMVSFYDNPEKYNNATMLAKIDTEMKKCMALDEQLKEMDREILVNPQFIQKCAGLHDEDMPGLSVKLPATMGYTM